MKVRSGVLFPWSWWVVWDLQYDVWVSSYFTRDIDPGFRGKVIMQHTYSASARGPRSINASVLELRDQEAHFMH